MSKFNFIMSKIFIYTALFLSAFTFSQNTIKGKVTANNEILAYANIYIKELNKGVETNENGLYEFENIPNDSYTIIASYVGFKPERKKTTISNEPNNILNFNLIEDANVLDDVVVSGTLKPVSRMETPVPVEVYTTAFLKKNPTSNIFEALQNVNGVRPQLNCNICNTGDIHINGLEGPYIMVTIDGMPIVSALSTVYGLSGIPNSLIDRVEVVL